MSTAKQQRQQAAKGVRGRCWLVGLACLMVLVAPSFRVPTVVMGATVLAAEEGTQGELAPRPPATPRPEAGAGTETPFEYQLPELEEPAAVNLWQVMGNLLLVLGLLGLLLWGVRRLLPGQLSETRRSRHMRVLDTLPVALNRSLLLVHVGGEVRLLASTEKGMVDLGKVSDLGAIEQEIAEEFGEVMQAEMEGTMARLKGRLKRLGEET